MLLHVRRAIVDAAVDALGDLVTLGIVTAVKSGRQAPMPIATAPYLLVYGRQERSANLTIGGRARKLDRELILAVEIVTGEGDNDEEADAIAADVEFVIADDPTLGGLAKDLWLSGTTIDANAEGEIRIGRARLEFTVSYHTMATAPDIPQLDFTRARNSQYAALL